METGHVNPGYGLLFAKMGMGTAVLERIVKSSRLRYYCDSIEKNMEVRVLYVDRLRSSVTIKG